MATFFKNYFDLFPFLFRFWRFRVVIPKSVMHRVLFDVLVTLHRKILTANYSICARFRGLREPLAPKIWLNIVKYLKKSLCMFNDTYMMSPITLNLNPLDSYNKLLNICPKVNVNIHPLTSKLPVAVFLQRF